jgi:hypothetical protein
MQNLRDLAWTTVYFALLGCTAPVLEALYINVAELDQVKERVRQTLHRNLGISSFQNCHGGRRTVLFPNHSKGEFEFDVYHLKKHLCTYQLKYVYWPPAPRNRLLYYSNNPVWGRYHEQDGWFRSLENRL